MLILDFLEPEPDTASPPHFNEAEVKTLVRHRDGYRCRLCGVTARQHVEACGKNLDVHRVEPGSLYSVAGCITVCRSCHGKLPKSPRINAKEPAARILPKLFPVLDIPDSRAIPPDHYLGCIWGTLRHQLVPFGIYSGDFMLLHQPKSTWRAYGIHQHVLLRHQTQGYNIRRTSYCGDIAIKFLRGAVEVGAVKGVVFRGTVRDQSRVKILGDERGEEYAQHAREGT